MTVTLYDARGDRDVLYCACGRNLPRWRVVGAFTAYACADCLASVVEQVEV